MRRALRFACRRLPRRRPDRRKGSTRPQLFQCMDGPPAGGHEALARTLGSQGKSAGDSPGFLKLVMELAPQDIQLLNDLLRFSG